MTTVGVSIRFVPAGVVAEDGGQLSLRGTLVLSPVSSTLAPACGHGVELETWPSQIEALLADGSGVSEPPGCKAGIEVLLAPVVASGTRACPPDLSTSTSNGGMRSEQQGIVVLDAARAHAIPVSKQGVRRQHLGALDALWATLIGAGGVSWSDLENALEAGGSQGAAAGTAGPRAAPDVVSTGGGQMSVLLALERARSLLERVRSPDDVGPPPAARSDPDLTAEDMDRPAERLRTRNGTPDKRQQTKPWLAFAAKLKDAPAPPPKKVVEEDRARQRAEADARSRMAHNLISEERKAAGSQADARRAYRACMSAQELRNRLDAMARVKPACAAPSTAASCAAAPDAGELQEALDRARALHYAGTQPDERGPNRLDAPVPQWDQQQLAHRRLFALASQPGLARLFNFAVDVAVPLTPGDLAVIGVGTAFSEVAVGARFLDARFAFVAARLAGVNAPRTIWTTAKLRLPWTSIDGPDESMLFWACTHEELDARSIGWSQDTLLNSAVAAQLDGVLDLGAARADGTAGTNPRFELATLDPRRATEADLHADAVSDRRGGLTAVNTMPSGGLLLIDRWRQYQAVAKATDRQEASSPGSIVLDAEALTVGLLLDVCVDTANGPVWRSLVERRITYTDHPILHEALMLLVPDGAERDALNAAPMTLTTRRRSTSGQQSPSHYAEEIVAQWLGPPLGVDLHAMDTVRDPGQHGTAGQTSVLGLSQEYSLPPRDSLERPPLQCFGWGVRVGVRPQLEGGVARRLTDAARIYQTGYGHRFALPPTAPGVRGRRILRHERIEGPVVTTPLQILQRPVNGPQETALEMVVRSKRDRDRGLIPMNPAATHRVFVPPSVAMTFADHHDVFANVTPEIHAVAGERRTRPPGGLRDVDYDRKGFGTFPIWSTQQASQGAIYPDEAERLRPDGGPDLKGLHYPAPTGDAVFMPLQRGHDPAGRRLPYYPDPAAELMVFRLRREDGSDIPGESLLVRTRLPGVAYPNVTPIAVELVRVGVPAPDQTRLGLDVGGPGDPPGSEALVHGHAAWTKRAARVFLDEGMRIHRGKGAVPASRVVVRLAPGERLQLDVWCLPTPRTLAYLFDLVESAALVILSAKPAQPLVCSTGTAFCDQLADGIGKPRAEMYALWTKITNGRGSRAQAGPCGAGQLLLPGPDELALVAEVLQRAARDTVSPELAARTTVWVTHAVDQPMGEPAFEPPGGRPALALQRIRLPGQAKGDPERVELTGWVALQQASTRFLEVEARGPGLITGLFDDVRRGRSADDGARGIWPSNGSKLVDGLEQEVWRSPGEVFGFEVAADCRVTWREEKATLLRVDGIPERPGPNGVQDGLDLGALEARLRPAAAPAANPPPTAPPPRPWPPTAPDPTPTRPQAITDEKARVICLELVSGSRTAPLIRQQDGKALDTSRQTVRSKALLTIALPASAPPARVAPLTILPAFRTEQAGLTLTRRCRLRIRARRPWFSSGAGERLGIVLWPPDVFARMGDGDLVMRDTDVDKYEPMKMDLAGFADLDLGPGGEFVTRWGGDPTRGGPLPTTWLVPPSAFPQAALMSETAPWLPAQGDADTVDVIYVPRATMPLPKDPNADPAAPPPEATSMEVALLAFAPRFDVDLEHWYFDVEIDPAAAAEPFVRLGLVRYQGNAPFHLRVSEPVVEWAQLLPERHLTVTIAAPAQPGDDHGVNVVVSGVAGPGHPPIEAAVELGPVMEISLWRRDADGIQTRVAPQVIAIPDAPTSRSVAKGPAGTTWSAELKLGADPMAPEDDARYLVVVTERNKMRPATYAEEPFDPVRAPDEEKVTMSGPRFAASLAIPKRSEQLPPPRATAPKGVLRVHFEGENACLQNR